MACKANGDGCMDETKLMGVKRINDMEFDYQNAHCFKIPVPNIGPAAASIMMWQPLSFVINL